MGQASSNQRQGASVLANASAINNPSNLHNAVASPNQALWAQQNAFPAMGRKVTGGCASGTCSISGNSVNGQHNHMRGADCVQRAQENFQFEKDLSRHNRLNDSAPCQGACTHQFQTACRRGCSQTDLLWEAGVTTPHDRFAREAAVLAKQLATQQNSLYGSQRYGRFDTVPTNGRNTATSAPLAPQTLAPNAALGINTIALANGVANGFANGSAVNGAAAATNGALVNNAIRTANQNAADEEANDAIQGVVRPPVNFNSANALASLGSNEAIEAALAANGAFGNSGSALVNGALPVNAGASGAIPHNGLGGAFGSAFGGSLF
jgi:hypothetical protein